MYRKKPVVIEARLWDGTFRCGKELREWIGNRAARAGNVDGHIDLRIETLEGVMKADVGDMIIKGVNGEFYPCKPDIFEKTYEAVE